MTVRYHVVDRVASGKVTVVEMDAESIASIRRWPWSRSNYAKVVDRLRQAGAASIVFDVDLSATSDKTGDDSLAAALARAKGRVALPTFGQLAGSGDRRTIDSLPIEKFRRNVALASVSIRPDSDGLVRRMPLGTITDGTPRPSLSAYIAAVSGTANRDFPIDMAIDPQSIPRLSFVAVRDGRFDPARVRGKNILIGATAIEMGDRYATQWGVVPGVVIQALAAETLLRGIPADGWPMVTLALAALIVALALSFQSSVPGIALSAVGAILVMTGVLVAQHRYQTIYPLAVPLAMITIGAIACLIRDVIARFRKERSVDEPTGLPNARALVGSAKGDAAVVLAVARIDNHDALRAILGPRDTANLIIRVGERMALIAEDKLVYRTADRQLAFKLTTQEAIDDTLHGLRSILLQPVEIGGRRVDIAVSIGIASGANRQIDNLIADATLAAEEARDADVFWRRAATDIDSLEQSISLMGELDEAITNGQIEVFYQPKYHLREKRIVGVEALVRWRHPVRGFIGPDLFIPIAEKTNRIAPLTLYVIGKVVRDLAAMRVASPDITAAINLSAKLLSSANFNAAVERIVTNAGLRCRRSSLKSPNPRRCRTRWRRSRHCGAIVTLASPCRSTIMARASRR